MHIYEICSLQRATALESKTMKKIRTYSHYSVEAAKLFGKLIKLHRQERKLPTQDLANRAGISRGTLDRIEKGDLKCEIGLVFEVATLVGVKLFDTDKSSLTMHTNKTDDMLALLPKSTHKPKRSLKDDF